MENKNIPYKIYLEENEMPKYWYNVRADMKKKPAPLLNPGTHQPMSAADLAPVFCEELIQQELDIGLVAQCLVEGDEAIEVLVFFQRL